MGLEGSQGPRRRKTEWAAGTVLSAVQGPLVLVVEPVTDLCLQYYSSTKKNKIIPFAATWMDLEMIILSEVSQKEKDKYLFITLNHLLLK